jgi:hypothetical protein
MAHYVGTVAYFDMYKLAEAERSELEAAGIDKEMGGYILLARSDLQHGCQFACYLSPGQD